MDKTTIRQKYKTNTRQNLAQLEVVIKCKQENKFTKHQINLFEKFCKKFGNTRASTLSYELTMLKQDLKSNSGKLKYEKGLASRKSLNKKFATNPKHVYRSMKGSNIIATKIPEKADVEEFWKNIWNVEKKFNQNATWLPELEVSYCTNITPKLYCINIDILNKVINKIKINKSSGRDKIKGFLLYKKLTFYRSKLSNFIQKNTNYKETLNFRSGLALH